MVRPYTRRAESGNVSRHIYRAKRTMGAPCKQPAFPTIVRKDRDGVQDVTFVQQLSTKKQTGNLVIAQNGCARTILSRQFK